MKEWLKSRLSEPSTYAGLSSLTMAAGYLARMHEAPGLAHAIDAASGALVSGDYVTGVGALLMGVLGVFLKEKN